MSEQYKGGTIPPDLPPRVRQLLQDHDRILTRGISKETVIVNLIGSGRNNGGPSPAVSYQVSNASGVINKIPAQPAGTMVAFRFTQLPTLKDSTTSPSGNIHLASGDLVIVSTDETILLASDGVNWHELARSRSGSVSQVFVPVALWGAVPNTGANQTTRIQAALDHVPEGSILTFAPGTYICNGVNVTRNNANIFLPAGCVLTATSGTPYAVINVVGTHNIVSSVDVVKNPSAADRAFPRGGERTIFVTPGAETAFAADSWIWIEDVEVPSNGLPADPEQILWIHGELVRIKTVSSGRLDLYTPLINSYTEIAPGPVAPRIRAVTPVEKFHIWGDGIISNPQAGASIAHGIHLNHTVGATVEGLTFERVWDSCVHATRSTEVKVNGVTMRNAVRFDSRGYGFTCHATGRVTVTGSEFKRLRHCVDFSTFSRICTASGNVFSGSTTGNLNTHPSVHGVTFSGNVIDGGHGQDAAVTSVEYGDSSIQASGINIDQGNKSITVTGNIIINCRLSGILVDMGGFGFATEFITIDGNIIENCQTFRRVAGAGAMTDHAGIALLETHSDGLNPGVARRGIICSNNVLFEPGQYGITVGVNRALVTGNWVYQARDKDPIEFPVDTSPTVGIGIWIRNSTPLGAPNGIRVVGNTVEECLQDGIRVGLNGASGGINISNHVVEGNTCIANGANGIFLEETALATVVHNNTCDGNGVDGINVQGPNGFFTSNRLIGNTNFGIRLIAGANNNLVKDNIIPTGSNGSGQISNGGTSNFFIKLDTDNDRVGMVSGTTPPAAWPRRLFELLDDTNPPFRITHTDNTRYTDLQANNDGTFGGLCLLPSTNAGGFKSVNIFGTNEGTGISIFDDGTDFYFRTTVARGFFLNCAAGQAIRLSQNFASYIGIDPGGEASSNVPFSSAAQFGTDTVSKGLGCVAMRTGGLPAAGFGSSIVFTLETNDGSDPGTFVDCGEWQTVLDTAATASVDTSQRFRVRDNATMKEVLRVAGALPGVRIQDGVGGAPNALLDVRGDAIFNEDGAAVNFRVESDTKANMLFVDGANDAVGIGTGAPIGALTVNGNSNFNGDLFDASGGDTFRVGKASQRFLGMATNEMDLSGRFTIGRQLVNSSPFNVATGAGAPTYHAVDSSGGAITVNLPAIGNVLTGTLFIFKRNGGNNVTITPNGAQTIDGAASYVLAADNDSITIASSGGTDWEII